VDVLLVGAFEKTFLAGDNSQVVPTGVHQRDVDVSVWCAHRRPWRSDTCKNTVYYLSKSSLGKGKPIGNNRVALLTKN
jgi:hypothetical protein